jgi:hypothetical protein
MQFWIRKITNAPIPMVYTTELSVILEVSIPLDIGLFQSSAKVASANPPDNIIKIPIA